MPLLGLTAMSIHSVDLSGRAVLSSDHPSEQLENAWEFLLGLAQPAAPRADAPLGQSARKGSVVGTNAGTNANGHIEDRACGQEQERSEGSGCDRTTRLPAAPRATQTRGEQAMRAASSMLQHESVTAAAAPIPLPPTASDGREPAAPVEGQTSRGQRTHAERPSACEGPGDVPRGRCDDAGWSPSVYGANHPPPAMVQAFGPHAYVREPARRPLGAWMPAYSKCDVRLTCMVSDASRFGARPGASMGGRHADGRQRPTHTRKPERQVDATMHPPRPCPDSYQALSTDYFSISGGALGEAAERSVFDDIAHSLLEHSAILLTGHNACVPAEHRSPPPAGSAAHLGTQVHADPTSRRTFWTVHAPQDRRELPPPAFHTAFPPLSQENRHLCTDNRPAQTARHGQDMRAQELPQLDPQQDKAVTLPDYQPLHAGFLLPGALHDDMPLESVVSEALKPGLTSITCQSRTSHASRPWTPAAGTSPSLMSTFQEFVSPATVSPLPACCAPPPPAPPPSFPSTESPKCAPLTQQRPLTHAQRSAAPWKEHHGLAEVETRGEHISPAQDFFKVIVT